MDSSKTVVIASNNEHKISEIRNLLSSTNWNFISLNEAKIHSDPEETASDFLGNARIKAQAAHSASEGMAALADDSGLMVDALNGEPGVFSARYASNNGVNVSDADNNALLLKKLENVPEGKRTARFACALCFIDEDDTEIDAWGTVEGVIGFKPKGHNGFGYDPLFWPHVFEGRFSMAQLTQNQKMLISHRGCALRDLANKLQHYKGLAL